MVAWSDPRQVIPGAAAKPGNPTNSTAPRKGRLAKAGTITEGWAVRTDRREPLDGVKVVESEGGLNVTVSPAIVLYSDADAASGNYEVSASLTQKRAPQRAGQRKPCAGKRQNCSLVESRNDAGAAPGSGAAGSEPFSSSPAAGGSTVNGGEL
jgi:hypothetical protein